MQNLRPYQENMPLTTQLVTVILVKSPTDIKFAITKEEKLAIVREFHRDGGAFVAVWTGEQCSHAFDLPAATMLRYFSGE